MMGDARRRAQLQVKVPMDQLKDRVCKCGGLLFFPVNALKELPPMYSPSGQYETSIAMVAFACVACGQMMTLRPEPVKVEEPKIILNG